MDLNRVRWILLAALVLLVVWVWSKRSSEVVEQAKPNAGQVVEQAKTTAGQVHDDSVNLKSSLESALAGLKANLQGVSDAASAKAALPQLEKEAAEFDKVRELSARLPTDSKSALAAHVTAARPTLDGLFDKVLAIPGVSDTVKPVIDGLRAKLDALSKA